MATTLSPHRVRHRGRHGNRTRAGGRRTAALPGVHNATEVVRLHPLQVSADVDIEPGLKERVHANVTTDKDYSNNATTATEDDGRPSDDQVSTLATNCILLQIHKANRSFY